MVDGRTGLKFPDFFDTKKAMVNPTCAQSHRWKESGHGVKYIRTNNAGKNIDLQERSNSSAWKLGIYFEFTPARNTSQQNHLAGLGFAHLANLG